MSPRNEHTLAFELARLRIKRAGGDIRALTKAFKDAKEDVSLTGLTFSGDVRARLIEVRRQFKEELDTVSEGLSGGLPQVPPPPGQSPPTPQTPDNELDQKIKKLLGR